MSPRVARLVDSVREAEEALAQRRHRLSVLAFLARGSLLNLLTTPVIYSLLVPLALLDGWLTLYQWTCFPIYRIARVARRDHFVIDRHRLGYLNLIEKAHCLFCSYANGVIGYAREIAARTEQYWCPIKHARPGGAPHAHTLLFFDYGDAAGYRNGLETLRQRLREGDAAARSRPRTRQAGGRP